MAENNHSPNEDERPFVAPCRELHWRDPFQWLQLGWQDVKQAPRQSLTYGAIMVLISYLISAATWYFGNLGLYLGLVSGFVFLGPMLALTLYAISARRERNARVSLRLSMLDARNALGDALVYTMILLVVFLIWARAATMIHVFFPTGSDPSPEDLMMFLGVGTSVGALFSAIVFAASAFSLPMILDRETDMVTAVITSVNAVLRNKPVMIVWAMCIGACVLVGFATAYLGFAVLLPLLGHATWHAYKATIRADDWPLREAAGTADSGARTEN
jgi:uncharacterized membrane protein